MYGNSPFACASASRRFDPAAAITAFLAVVLACLALLASAPAASAADADSRYLNIPVSEAQRGPRVIKLGLNKSLIIDLPRPAKDVLVSAPNKADAVMRTPRRAYVIGNEVGQTNIFFFDEAGQQIVSLELHIERDTAALESMFTRLIPGSNIQIDAINENIVLSGTASSQADAGRAADIAGRFAGDAAKVLNMIAVTGKDQVYLKVTVAEIQRNAAKQLGIDIDALINSTGEVAIRAITDNPFAVAGGPISATGVGINYLSGDTEIDAAISAMEQNGVLRTLAEPTLTAVSGEQASFLAGGEFPVPVGADDGKVTIEFKPFGVGLTFTPVVLSEGRISLRVKTEVSEITTDGAFSIAPGDTNALISIPGLRVRRAETTIELPSGGTLAIAGLLQESTRQAISGLPGAKDIPVLGTLFRSRDFQNEESELVVIVTPYTVNPGQREQFALPTDNFTPASDYAGNFMGRVHELYGVQGQVPNGQYSGEVGFIVK